MYLFLLLFTRQFCSHFDPVCVMKAQTVLLRPSYSNPKHETMNEPCCIDICIQWLTCHSPDCLQYNVLHQCSTICRPTVER